MGDIKKQKKKFYSPSHPWQASRIEEEKGLSREYGVKNKREIWKMHSILKKFYAQAKKLTTTQTKQSAVERAQLLAKLYSLALLDKDSKLEDVLTITIKDVMNRRLQTVVYKKKLARTVNQARQFIVHNHIFVGKNNITMPSYLVSRDEEVAINFAAKSSLLNPDHPERVIEEKEEKPVAKKSEKKEKAPKKKQEKKETKKKETKKKPSKDTEKGLEKAESSKKEPKKEAEEKPKEKPKEETKGEK